MIPPQVFSVRSILTYTTVVLILCSIVGCQTRYGFRDKVRVDCKEEMRVNKPLQMATVLARSEPIIFKGKVGLEKPKFFIETLGVKETSKAQIAPILEIKNDEFKKENPKTILRKVSSPQKANPWFAGFVIFMVLALIALILFAPAALLISFLVLLLLGYLLLRIIRKGSNYNAEMKLGKEGREASKQTRRHRAVVLFMSLSILFLILGSIFFYPLIVPLLLCIPLLIVSFLALKNESAKGRRLLYFFGLMLGLFLTIFFTAAIISFSPPG
jgi:hypothetical protein